MCLKGQWGVRDKGKYGHLEELEENLKTSRWKASQRPLISIYLIVLLLSVFYVCMLYYAIRKGKALAMRYVIKKAIKI